MDSAAQCLGSLFHVELEIPHRVVITQGLEFTYIAPEIGEEGYFLNICCLHIEIVRFPMSLYPATLLNSFILVAFLK